MESKNNSKELVSISEEARDFLIESLESQGKNSAKLSLVFGRNSKGQGAAKYQLIAVEGPDVEVDLGNGKSFILDGSTLPLLKGTKIDLKEGEDEQGNKITGFVFENPNDLMPLFGGGCSGCPSNQQGGCSTGGCSTEEE